MTHPARVLLVSINREDQPQPVYPLALDVLGAALRSSGHEVFLHDCRTGGSLREALQTRKPDLVGVSLRNIDNNQSVGTKDYLPELVAVMSEIREACRAPVVLGGSGYSLFPREILLRSGADLGVVGPGEHVIAELAAGVRSGASPSELPGVVSLKGGECVVTPPCPPEALPGALDRDEELVRHYWREGGVLNVQVSRGCIWKCAYCTYPLLEGRRMIRREVRAAVDEIETLKERTGANHFFIVDSVFNLEPDRADAFAEELLRRRLSIVWSAFFGPRGMTAKSVRLWKESGLEGVELGIDALCDEVLEEYRKPFTVREAQEAVAACAEADLPCMVYLIFGGPGETPGTLEETIARAHGLPGSVFCAFTGMRIYPGTELAQRAAAEGIITPGEDLLAPRFYLSPKLDPRDVEARCAELGRRQNWLVVGGGIEEKCRQAAGLRKRNRRGALWRLLRPR